MTLDDPLWQEVEARLDRSVPAALRQQVREMPSSPVTRWLKSKTLEEKGRAADQLVWHLGGVLLALDTGLSPSPAADSMSQDELDALGSLPNRWEESYVTLASEGWLTQLLTGKSRAVRTSLYKVGPVPEKWKAHSRGVLRAHEKLQRVALWKVRRIGANKWADFSGIGGRAPLPLEPTDFVPLDELDALFARMRESGDETGEREWIAWPDLQNPGARKEVEFGVNLRPQCQRQWLGNYSPLYGVKNCCQELRFHTGIAEEDAVLFLLCNADVALPWLTLTIHLDNAPRGGRFELEVGSPLVPVGLVEHWYRLAREYVFAEQNDAGAYTPGEDSFPMDFVQWLKLVGARQTRPERSERDLLVEFVGQRREDGVAWSEILLEWNHFRPAAAYASVLSLKSVYQRAKRRQS